MKVLDVGVLQSGINDTIKDIDNLQGQISAVQRAVRDFAGLDDALSGKGGQAIRSFYNDFHQPFLVFLLQSLTDYQHTLNEIKEAVETFEPNANGYVSQEFLKNEVKDGLDDVKTTAIDFTSEINSIIGSVQDIVYIEKTDESEVVDNVQRGKEKADHIVEELNALDEYGVSQLKQTKQDLDTMLNYLSEIESKFQSGDLSIKDYSVSDISDIQAFHAITENVYGEGGIFRSILNKFTNAEPITAFESERLYHYFQTEILNDSARKELKEIASIINENDADKIMERLNEKVVISNSTLEDEMLLVQAYVYMGEKSPNEANIDRDTKQKLDVYLVLLKHIKQSSMGLSKIDTLNYKNNPHGIKGHFIEAKIKTGPYRSKDRGNRTIKEYRDYALRDNGLDRGLDIFHNFIEVTYFSTVDANNFNNYIKTKKMIEEEANYAFNYILNLTMNGLLGKVGGGPIKELEDFALEKEELRRNIKIEEVKNTAGILDLEFVISQDDTHPNIIPGYGRKIDIEFYPTEYTFDFLDRWKKAYKNNKNIPYPGEELIQSQNWYEIVKFWIEHHTEIRDDNLYDYIRRGD